MLNIDHLVKRPGDMILARLARVAIATLIVVALASIGSCGGALPTPGQDGAAADAGRPAFDGATNDSGPYCNTTLPQNQTKFLSVLVLHNADGSDCLASYEVSFGERTFGCGCDLQSVCETALLTLIGQAQACPMAGW